MSVYSFARPHRALPRTKGASTVKIVLAGNPNAGKTTLFNALTHSRLKTGNWHGVTTSPAYKTRGGITYVDVPGLYSFNGYSMEEACAAEEIASSDAVIVVADSLTLLNSLEFIGQILSLNANAAVYLTKIRQLKRRGGRVDENALASSLGVPVTSSVKQLKKIIPLLAESGQTHMRSAAAEYYTHTADGRASASDGRTSSGDSGTYASSGRTQAAHGRFYDAGSRAYGSDGKSRLQSAVNKAYYGGNCGLTRAEKLFLNRYFALFFFIFAILATFFFAFFPGMPGEYLKGLAEELISVKLRAAAASVLPDGKVQSLLCDGIIGGAGGVLSFVPQLFVLYLFLTLLDESGVMSALSFVTDGVFERVKLSGRAAFSLISGFGCTAAAILTTRGFTSKNTQLKAVAALAYIPCGAKMPVFLTLLSPLFKNPFFAVSAFYFAGVAISLAVCALWRGEGEDMLSEVTPLGLPSPVVVLKKLFFYIKGFIIKVATAVMLFCIVSWVLSNFTFALAPCDVQDSMLAAISRALLPLFLPMGITDWRLAFAFISGFSAKENIAATISMLMPLGTGLELSSALAASTFLLLCPPCISAFSASVKETGLKFSIKLLFLQLVTAFLLSYAVHFLFSLFT